MKLAMFWAILFLLACSARADDKPGSSPHLFVSIKVVQVADAKDDMMQLEVTNTFTSDIAVDQEALQEPDFEVSRDISDKGSDEIRELATDATHGSTGGRWTLAQLQRREPKRVVTIHAGEIYTTKVAVNSLLRGITPKFPRGKIQVTFTFHKFLLAVGGKETNPDTFRLGVKAARTSINWHSISN